MQFVAALFLFFHFPTNTWVQAFDYGPVGNGIFWVVLSVWSMGIAYVLLQKRSALFNFVASFTHALLSPGVKPHKRAVRNPHIVADTYHEPPVAYTPRISYTHNIPHTSHPVLGVTPAASHQTPQPVVHSTHMTATHASSHAVPKIPTPKPETGAHAPSAARGATAAAIMQPAPPVSAQTTDTLTLEVIAGVPKMILKREVKK